MLKICTLLLSWLLRTAGDSQSSLMLHKLTFIVSTPDISKGHCSHSAKSRPVLGMPWICDEIKPLKHLYESKRLSLWAISLQLYPYLWLYPEGAHNISYNLSRLQIGFQCSWEVVLVIDRGWLLWILHASSWDWWWLWWSSWSWEDRDAPLVPLVPVNLWMDSLF